MKKKYHGKKAVARKAKRTYRDSLFRSIYAGKDERSKRWLLSLYNALSGKNYTDTAELEITTLEDVIYVSMKNDLSFLLDSQLCLFEHQSTVNPNMLRTKITSCNFGFVRELCRTKFAKFSLSLMPRPCGTFPAWMQGKSKDRISVTKFCPSERNRTFRER